MKTASFCLLVAIQCLIFPFKKNEISLFFLFPIIKTYSFLQNYSPACPFTYFRETCSDFAHVTVVSTPNTTCLGTFISEQFALVRASCLPPAGTVPSSIRLVAAKTAQSIGASAVFIHPDFQRSGSAEPSVMDLAVLKLNGSVR